MRNSSHRPGCMRALPASQSCQVRRVEWMRSAADVCESPAASRAARTSSGVGFRAALPARLRLGWLGIDADDIGFNRELFRHPVRHVFSCIAQNCGVVFFYPMKLYRRMFWDVCLPGKKFISFLDCPHFVSPAPIPRRGVNDLSTIQSIHGFRVNARGF